MTNIVGDHAVMRIKREGPLTTHHISSGYIMGGRKVPGLIGHQHPDSHVRRHLAEDGRLQHDPQRDVWSIAPSASPAASAG